MKALNKIKNIKDINSYLENLYNKQLEDLKEEGENPEDFCPIYYQNKEVRYLTWEEASNVLYYLYGQLDITKDICEDIVNWNEVKYYYHIKIVEFHFLEKLIKSLNLKGYDKTGELLVIKEADEEEKDFLPVQQHDGLLDILYNLGSFKEDARKDKTKSKAVKKTKKGEISVVKDEEKTLDELMKNLTDSQLQLILYCIYLRGIQGGRDKIEFDIKDYFNVKGLDKQTKNVNKLKDDFKTLQNTYIKFTAKLKGKTETVSYSKILAITDLYTRNNIIKFTFGDWAKTLSDDQYLLISKMFFQHKRLQNEPYTIKLSLKLHELIRVNRRKNKNTYSIKVKNVIDLLGFNENTISAKGFVKACKDPIDNTLDLLSESQGLNWEYRKGDHETFKDFKNDYIDFNYPGLHEAYKNLIGK